MVRRRPLALAFVAIVCLGGGYPALTGAGAVPAAASLQQWVTNQSVETDLSGWTGNYNATSANSRVVGGYDGNYSLRSTNSGSSVGSNGFIDKPHWIDGTAGKATIAGTNYTVSLWVKADVAGQRLCLFLREVNASGSVVNKAPYNVAVSFTAATTNWFNIGETYAAVGTGDSLGVYVYASNVASHQGFDADLMSMTSPGSMTPDISAPTAPSNVLVTPVGTTGLNVTWTAATDNVGVTGYVLQRDGAALGSTAGTSYSDSGLLPGTSYSYSVAAVDAAGNAGPPATATGSTSTVATLGPPTNLQATTPSPTEVDLSWDPAPGATGYTLQRDGSTVGTTTATSYKDTGLTGGTTYSYVVVASDDVSDTSPSAPLTVTTPPVAGPNPTLTLCGNPAPTTAVPVQHVVVVMLENNSYKRVVGGANAPYQTSLSRQCGNATAMFGATHTSAANYLAFSAGEYPATSPPGCGTVGACADSSENVYHQLDSAGLSWRNYEESMPFACDRSSGGAYKIGHNPALFYTDLTSSKCQTNDVPVGDLTAQSGAFWTDLQNQSLPSLSFVTPNMKHDGEGPGGSGAALLAADTWTKNFLATVVQSNSYQAGNTLVLVTYDEGQGGDSHTGEDCTNQSLDLPVVDGVSAHQDSCHVALFVVYPFTPAGATDGTFFDLYSLTKTVENEFGLPLIAHTADSRTTSLVGHFGLS